MTRSTPGRSPRLMRGIAAAFAAGALTAGSIGPATAATVYNGYITPLGLAVEGSDVYVANAFAGFVTRNGGPFSGGTVLAAGQDAYASGVDVDGGEVVFTGAIGGPPGLYRVTANPAAPDLIADLATYEATVNPDQDQVYGLTGISSSCLDKFEHKVPSLPATYSGVVDSNPYAVTFDPDGGWFVADAAANAILHVSETGAVSTVAVLPPVPQVLPKELRKELRVPRIDAEPNPDRVKLPQCVIGETYLAEPVPTDVEIGPGGMLYVSLLPGLTETGGKVVVVDPDNGNVVATVASGLEAAVDTAVAPDGTVYVAELNGNRVSVWSGGTKQDEYPVPLPGAIEVEGGTVYVTTGALTDAGTVETLN